MWQPTSSSRPSGREAAHVGEALGEGQDATLLLLDVADVLDVAVGVLHREVVRPRVHVDDPARAALDDAPEAPELLRRRRVVALRVDRLGQRRVVAHAVVVGLAQRAAHRDLAAGALLARCRGVAPSTASGVRCDMAAHSTNARVAGARSATRRGRRGIASRVASCASRITPANAPRGGRWPRRRRLVHPPHPVPDDPSGGRRGRLRLRRALVGERRGSLRRRLGRPPAGAPAAVSLGARAAGSATPSTSA